MLVVDRLIGLSGGALSRARHAAIERQGAVNAEIRAAIMGHDRDNAAGQRSAFATSRTDFWRAPKSTNDWRRQEADMTLDDVLLKVLARERGVGRSSPRIPLRGLCCEPGSC
jgi:hypothetical protein